MAGLRVTVRRTVYRRKPGWLVKGRMADIFIEETGYGEVEARWIADRVKAGDLSWTFADMYAAVHRGQHPTTECQRCADSLASLPCIECGEAPCVEGLG